MESHYTVEPMGEVIVARMHGEPTEAMLREMHERVLQLARETGSNHVLYDALHMTPPPVDVPLAQQQLDRDTGGIELRRAIVVPNTKLAYLARLAFGEGDYRVFYDDIDAATLWLTGKSPA